MRLRSGFRLVVRLGLASAVALSGLALGAGDADARRGGKVRSSQPSKSHDRDAEGHKSGNAHSDEGSGGVYAPSVRVRSREAARSNGGAEGASSRRNRHPYSGRAAAAPDVDHEVPGCPAGMICTVCLAGCAGDSGSIVDAQPKTLMPKPKY